MPTGLERKLDRDVSATITRYEPFWGGPARSYTSFTNATAFSPTDTMPLTAMAKCPMAGQSLVSLVTIGLVVARAVNIL